jgi:hypothetical protein
MSIVAASAAGLVKARSVLVRGEVVPEGPFGAATLLELVESSPAGVPVVVDASVVDVSVVEASVVDVSVVEASVVEVSVVDVSVVDVSTGVLVSVAVGSVGAVSSPYAALGPMTSSIAIANARSVETKRAAGFWCRNSTRDRIRVRPFDPALCFFICVAPMWRRPAGRGAGCRKHIRTMSESGFFPCPAKQPVKRESPCPQGNSLNPLHGAGVRHDKFHCEIDARGLDRGAVPNVAYLGKPDIW